MERGIHCLLSMPFHTTTKTSQGRGEGKADMEIVKRLLHHFFIWTYPAPLYCVGMGLEWSWNEAEMEVAENRM